MIKKQVLDSVISLWESVNEKEYWESNKEKDFQEHIIQVLRAAGMAVIVLPDESTRYVFPDLLCHYTDCGNVKKSFYIECKRKRGSLHKGQKISFETLTEFVDVYTVRKKKHWLDLLDLLLNDC